MRRVMFFCAFFAAMTAAAFPKDVFDEWMNRATPSDTVQSVTIYDLAGFEYVYHYDYGVFVPEPPQHMRDALEALAIGNVANKRTDELWQQYSNVWEAVKLLGKYVTEEEPHWLNVPGTTTTVTGPKGELEAKNPSADMTEVAGVSWGKASALVDVPDTDPSLRYWGPKDELNGVIGYMGTMQYVYANWFKHLYDFGLWREKQNGLGSLWMVTDISVDDENGKLIVSGIKDVKLGLDNKLMQWEGEVGDKIAELDLPLGIMEGDITNKLKQVAFDADYNSLTNRPAAVGVEEVEDGDGNTRYVFRLITAEEIEEGRASAVATNLAGVAVSGRLADLEIPENKVFLVSEIGETNINGRADMYAKFAYYQVTTNGLEKAGDSPETTEVFGLSPVAFSGSYTGLTERVSILVKKDNEAGKASIIITNYAGEAVTTRAELALAAMTGKFKDLDVPECDRDVVKDVGASTNANEIVITYGRLHFSTNGLAWDKEHAPEAKVVKILSEAGGNDNDSTNDTEHVGGGCSCNIEEIRRQIQELALVVDGLGNSGYPWGDGYIDSPPPNNPPDPSAPVVAMTWRRKEDE